MKFPHKLFTYIWASACCIAPTFIMSFQMLRVVLLSEPQMINGMMLWNLHMYASYEIYAEIIMGFFACLIMFAVLFKLIKDEVDE